MSVVLFHNPTCSKSRALLAELERRGIAFDRVDYLDAPLSRADLLDLMAALSDPPGELVRRDARFTELGLDPEKLAPERADADTVAALLSAHPELMQRPVLRVGERAAIGRPAERALSLLEHR